MNEPIISPWLIYFVGRLNTIKGILLIALLFSGVIVGLWLLGGMRSTEKEKEVLRIDACVFGVALVLFAIIPDKEEALAMYATSKVTPANVQAVGESVDKVTDKAVEKIIRIIEAAKKEEEKND